MHVLLVEDDEELAARIGQGLSQAGFVVRRAVDVIQGLALGLQPQARIIILDLDLRGKSGLELLKEWRAHGLAAPVNPQLAL